MTLRFTPDCVSVADNGAPPHLSLVGGSTPFDAEAANMHFLNAQIEYEAALAVHEGIAAHVATPDRDGIEAAHAMIAAAPQIAVPTYHYFADGIYAREIHVPAGAWVVGEIHTESHINILSHGEASVATETGSKRIRAPATFEAVAGRKVVGFAHTDVVWTTFHANPTEERDVEKLFSMLTTQIYPDAKTVIAAMNGVVLLEGAD
jgi:hypothetical protein